MALPKKGQRNQFIFPMIEADGLSQASTLTASQLRSGGSRKFWGVNHNDAALATSGTPSQTASLLRSGLFQIKMNAAECVYDRMNILFGYSSCVPQDIVVDFCDYDDSDIMSMLIGISAAESNTQSYLVGLSAEISNIYSAVLAAGGTSDLESRLSDIQSYLAAISAQLSNFQSQFDSRVTGVVATVTELKSAVGSVMSSPLSDIHSGVTAGRSVASDTYSLVLALSAQISDIYSAVQAVATTSDLRSRLSDIQSYLAGLSANISDVYSAVQAVATTSDLRSRLSDIQSYLVAMSGMLSDVHSGVTAGRSVASDTYSLLTALDLSAALSDIQSGVTAGRSVASDTYSLLFALSGQISNIYSAIGDISVALNASQISDLASQIADAVGFTPGEIASAVSTVLQPGFDVVDDTYSYLTTVRPEPSAGAPGATITWADKTDYLYKAWRNQTKQSNTSYQLYNNAVNNVDQSALVSDAANVFTRGEVGAG